MFGRPREHHWLGSDSHARIAAIVVTVLAAVVLALLATLVVAALAD